MAALAEGMDGKAVRWDVGEGVGQAASAPGCSFLGKVLQLWILDQHRRLSPYCRTADARTRSSRMGVRPGPNRPLCEGVSLSGYPAIRPNRPRAEAISPPIACPNSRTKWRRLSDHARWLLVSPACVPPGPLLYAASCRVPEVSLRAIGRCRTSVLSMHVWHTPDEKVQTSYSRISNGRGFAS